MRRAIIWALCFVLLLTAAVLTGCVPKKEISTDAPAAGKPAGSAPAETGSLQPSGTAPAAAADEIEWRGYTLRIDELREKTDADNFLQKDPPQGSRYIIARLLCKDGKIETDEISKESVDTLVLRSAAGQEWTCDAYNLWGIKFGDDLKFSTDPTQEGFSLVFIVSEEVALADLKLASVEGAAPSAAPTAGGEGDYVTLTYEDESARVTITDIGFNADGEVTVTMEGEGIGGSIRIRNNKTVIPYQANVVSGGETYVWKGVTINATSYVFRYELKEKPEQVVVYGADNEKESRTFDVASGRFLP